MASRNILLRAIIFSMLFSFLATMLYPQENNSLKTTRAHASLTQFSRLVSLGEDLRGKGEYKEAIRQFNGALLLAKKNNYEEGKLDALMQLGVLYWNIGNLKESSAKYVEALSIARKLDQKEKINFCTRALEIYKYYIRAKDDVSSGDYQKSNDAFRIAIDLAKGIYSKEHELKCLRQLGLNYWDLDNLQSFFLLNREALSIAQQLNHKKEEGRCLNNIGIFYWKIDNYSEALKNYEKSLEIARALGDIEGEANCLNNMGTIYIDAGNFERALEYLISALDIDRKLKNQQSISQDLINIGSTFRRKGIISEDEKDFDSALNYYRDSLGIAIKNQDKVLEIRVLNNIGTIYSYKNQNTKALENLQSAFLIAKKLQDTEAMSAILNNIGAVYSRKKEYQESTKYYQQAIDLALQIKGGKLLWEPYLDLANSYKNLNNAEDALNNYRKSISVIEKIRSSITLEELRATFFGTERRIEAYQGIIDLLISLNQREPGKAYGAQAFNYLERAKARSFLDSIEVSKINITEGISQQLLNQEADLMNEISKLYTRLLTPQLSAEQKNAINKELETYDQQLESLKREIRASSPAYANLRYPRTITLSEAQRDLLDDKTAFFAYTLAKDNSYAFVITKKKLRIFPLPARQEIQKLVREYLRVITDVQNQNFRVGYRLYRDLVRPGLDEPNIKNIVFVPDDVLYFLPFETLLVKNNTREWLIKNYNIAYASSLSSLRELIERKKSSPLHSKKDLLAIGDPAFGIHETSPSAGGSNGGPQTYAGTADYNFSRLKYSGIEIQKIASLFKPAKRYVLERSQASEENVKKQDLSDFRVIHFATHALIDDKKPARSAIILALDQNPKEDGFLQMREIFNLKLNADLVTLSACETGLGQLIRGEGIEGLNRAFFYAGASSVMLSLWAINDQASYQLLERFYAHLCSSETIINSLRRAKLELIRSDVLAHPYYWGGFIVTGDTSERIFPRKMNKWIVVTVSLCAGLALLILIINREIPSLFSPKD